MKLRTATILLVLSFSPAICVAQDEDCPKRTVINNGICRGSNGDDCSQRELVSQICFEVDPQYTKEAAQATITGTVRMAATIEVDGCAHNIKVISGIGHGLDEASVLALEHFRFRKVTKPRLMTFEFNFDPQSPSTTKVDAPKCKEFAHQRSTKN